MTVEAKWLSIQKNNSRLYLNGEEVKEVNINGKVIDYFVQGNIAWLRVVQEQGEKAEESIATGNTV